MSDKKIELIVFDIAGTTVSDGNSVAKTFEKALKKYNYVVPVQEINLIMGYRKSDAIRMMLKKFNLCKEEEMDHKVFLIHETFNEEMIHFYKTSPDIKPQPYAEEIFQYFFNRSVRIALNTGFNRIITNAVLERLNWKTSHFLSSIVTSDEVPMGRPYPYMIQSIMNQTGVKDSKCVAKVGDTEVDILEGRNAQCGMVISVTTGAATRDQLNMYSPDHIIDSLSTLRELIN